MADDYVISVDSEDDAAAEAALGPRAAATTDGQVAAASAAEATEQQQQQPGDAAGALRPPQRRRGGRPGNNPQQRDSRMGGAASSSDDKILILFDLNGVLTDHTPSRSEKKCRRNHVVRPHIEELLRLLPHFRLGVYSSATAGTVAKALDVIHRRLAAIAQAKGGLYVPAISDLFSVVCDRSCCRPDPKWLSREDGKEWDTIKPLRQLGFDLRRTLLVDNDDYKSQEGEESSMLLVPHWEKCPVSDRDLPLLVQLLLQRLKDEPGDVRRHLNGIRRDLLLLRERPLPPQLEQQALQQQQLLRSAGPAKLQQGPAPGRVRDPLMQKGYRVEAFARAPASVQELVKVLSHHCRSSSSSSKDGAAAAVDIDVLLAAAAAAAGNQGDAAAAAAAAAPPDTAAAAQNTGSTCGRCCWRRCGLPASASLPAASACSSCRTA
ncbi:hypothetical protein COO60DRAFT_267782 [Scenedesmus sp. NREL 46B-D3]|nr:hypothetical protein COO60DRAFT_267782 [Scenedesmus sp. NREL 46B-D3]